jgi:acetyltransferase-like isoleucine patch superfamily enzyme
MNYYHTTAIENKESIIENGINAMVTDKITLSDDQIQAEGVFLFTDSDSAYDFGVDCVGGEFVIFEVTIDDDVVIDPEYDGEAVFVERAIKSSEIEVFNVVD